MHQHVKPHLQYTTKVMTQTENGCAAVSKAFGNIKYSSKTESCIKRTGRVKLTKNQGIGDWGKPRNKNQYLEKETYFHTITMRASWAKPLVSLKLETDSGARTSFSSSSWLGSAEPLGWSCTLLRMCAANQPPRPQLSMSELLNL